MEALQALGALRSEIDRVEAAQVRRAREKLSWAEIARLLGVTKQSAHAKYARRCR